MKRSSVIILICCAVIACNVLGCTENQRAKKFGGTMTINLPNCQKLVTPTWKDSNLWYATRPMLNNEIPITTTFQEDSKFGVIQGAVIFIETCSGQK